MKPIFTLLFIFNLLVASAQVQEQLAPEERKQLTRVTEPVTLYKGFLRARIFGSYFSVGNSFDQNGNRKTTDVFSGNFLSSVLTVEYGVADRFEISSSVGYQNGILQGSISYQQPITGIQDVIYVKLNYTGINSAAFTMRYQLLQDKPGSPSFVVGLGTYIPAGRSEGRNYVNQFRNDPPSAKGEWAFMPVVELRKILYPVTLEIRAFYRHYLGADKVLSPTGDPQRVVSGSLFGIVPQINFHLNEWVSVYQEIRYSSIQSDDFEGTDFFGTHTKFSKSGLSYAPGLTFQIKRLRLEQSVIIPIAGRNLPSDTNYTISLSYIF